MLQRESVEGHLLEFLSMHAIRTVFQPIVELATGEVVAYEALARGPTGSPYESPVALFRAARAQGVLAEVDWLCRMAALQAALESGLRRPYSLFINVDPDALRTVPPASRALMERAGEELSLVVEVTEIDVIRDPASLFEAVRHFRSCGWSIAVDDVGVEDSSLALMPFLQPEVIKLDRKLMQGGLAPRAATAAAAAVAQAERTGAVVLAEGIETPAHLARARAMGATLGQGWLFGRPEPLPVCVLLPSTELQFAAPPESEAGTPFDIMARQRPVQQADKRLLLSMSRVLELQAMQLGEPYMVLSTFQHRRHFTLATAALYEQLARDGTLVTAMGIDMPAEPAPGVRGVALDPRSMLVDEWDLLVISPHFAGGFVARDCYVDSPEMDREFDFALSYNRELLLAAARPLMSEVVALP